jgi:large subunit ribosomal protein L16
MLSPRKIKHRKAFRGKRTGLSHRGSTISYGTYAIKGLEAGWITGRQIEAARRAMTRYIKRGGQVWIRVFPDLPVTSLPAEVTMGGGKGAPSHFVAVVRPGRILFELGGVPKDVAEEAMRLAQHKLPIATRFISKEETQ